MVELPGVQDTAEAKRILGKTANLEFRLGADAPARRSPCPRSSPSGRAPRPRRWRRG
ncbi:hypothetical protein [Streptomyces sp. NPDC007346]|uniref:hypothetical protein n=1 Tax=Streptomyces sp. NPDC007346 TaxID=3154682 RepID=UPI003451A08F